MTQCNTEKAFKDLIIWIEENTTWESYGYYGPLVYTGPLLDKIAQIASECKIDLSHVEIKK